jgi:hypothetical protein
MSYQFNNKLVMQLGEQMASGAVLAAGILLQREIKERLNLGSHRHRLHRLLLLAHSKIWHTWSKHSG